MYEVLAEEIIEGKRYTVYETREDGSKVEYNGYFNSKSFGWSLYPAWNSYLNRRAEDKPKRHFVTAALVRRMRYD